MVLALSAYLANRQSELDQTLGDAIANLPSWLSGVFVIGYALAALFGIWLLIMAVVRRRWDVLAYLVVAFAVAMCAGLIFSRVIDGAWPIMLPELGDAPAVARFPVLRVAAVTALVIAVSPHVTRPIRWLGWVFIALVSVSGVGLGLGLPTDATGAIGIGFMAAGVALLAFGSPAAYPRNDDLVAQLSKLGIDLQDLNPASTQTWGARTLDAVDSHGRSLVVKVYGTDARDAQVLSRMWRDLWYRDIGPSVPWSRLQQVEHEALVTVLAGAAGVTCPSIVVAATSENGDAVLVTDRRGVDCSTVGVGEITDDVLVAIWSEIAVLHTAQISHGALDLSAVLLDGDTAILTGFQSGSLSATEARLAIDVVEMLVSMAVIVGADRAVASAIAGLGSDTVEGVVPYLQLPAISAAARRALDKPGKIVKQLRETIIEQTGMDKPDAVKLRRVGWQDIVVTALIILVAAIILRQVAAIDMQEVWQTIQTADWPWVVAALILAQFVLLPYAVSLMAVVRVKLPLKATVILQSAIQFIGIAVPSAAGRIATNVAYLRKFGLGPTAAVTQGALDSFSMFLVQSTILLITFAFGDVDFGFSTSGSDDGNWEWVILLVVVVILVGVGAIVFVKKLRKQVLHILSEVRGAMSVLFEEPKRAVVLFSSNFVSQFILGATMWLAVVAIGEQVSFLAALAVVVGAVMLGGLAPTPGGVGVQEAVLAAGLVGVGLSSSDATAAAIIYRIVTFALPPFWGAVSLAWLRKNDYV